MKNCVVQVLLLSLIAPLVAGANGLETSKDYVASPPHFGEMSYEEGNRAVNELVGDIVSRGVKQVGPEFVAGLVDQLRRGKLGDEKKVLVIYLLGQLRPKDTNSVEVLIDNIDLKAPRLDPAFDIARWGQYPAQEALVRIGVPSVDPILNHIPTEGNALRRHLMCGVLKSVEGKKAASNQLKERLARESNPSKRANLELSLKEMES